MSLLKSAIRIGVPTVFLVAIFLLGMYGIVVSSMFCFTVALAMLIAWVNMS